MDGVYNKDDVSPGTLKSGEIRCPTLYVLPSGADINAFQSLPRKIIPLTMRSLYYKQKSINVTEILHDYILL